MLVRDGARFWPYQHRDAERVDQFAARLTSGDADGRGDAEDAATAELQLLIYGDLPAPDGAQAYALHPAGLDTSRLPASGSRGLGGRPRGDQVTR